MSSIDNNLGGGGGSASASGKKGAIQLSDGNFNLTSNKELKSDPKTGTITTTGLTTTGTILASTISTTYLVADTVQMLTVVGDASITGDATVDGTITTTNLSVTDDVLITGNLSVSGGVITITSTSTESYALNVQNSGTGPAIIANQTGLQPVINFQDDGTSVLYISGGEGSHKAGYVGIGSTAPHQKLDVVGNVLVSGTVTSTDVFATNVDGQYISSSSITVAGNIVGNDLYISNVQATKTISCDTISATSNVITDYIEADNVYVTNSITSSYINVGSLSATQNIRSSSITATYADITASLTVSSLTPADNDLIVTGNITATEFLTVSESVTASSATISGQVNAGTLSSTGNGYFSSNIGVGTTDTAEYKFLVNNGSSNLFGVPLTPTGLVTGKTLVYDGNGWVYDNAGPANGNQVGEILAWDGSEWSANSAVVVEGTSVGIGFAQPTEKLDVAGNVKATEFIGSGDPLTDLNASNITSGTLDNARLPGTISVSNIESSNLTITNLNSVTNNAFIGGTLSASNIETSNLTVTNSHEVVGTLSASNVETSNLTVTGPIIASSITSSANVNIDGTLSASILYSETLITSNTETSNLTVTNLNTVTNDAFIGGTLSASNVETSNLTVTGPIIASSITSSANVNIDGTLSASILYSETLITSNTETSNLTVTNLNTVTNDAFIGGTLSASNVETSNLTVTNTHNVLGNLFVSHTVSAPTLLISEDARIDGNLTVSGGVVSITTSTTETSNLVIINEGTGPALVVKQTGQKPIIDIQDDSASALFISGGEQGPGDRNGFVGINTTTPAYRLDVNGDANVATNLFVHGTLSTANLVATYLVQGATISSTGSLTAASATVSGQVQASGTITTSDSFLHYGGQTDRSLYMNSNVPGLSTNTYVYTRAIVNQDQKGESPAAIVFGNSNIFGSNQISLVTRGENRLYIDNTGDNVVNVPGTLSASNVESSNLTVANNLFVPGTPNASLQLLANGGNTDDCLQVYNENGNLKASIQYNGDATFRTITVSNIQGGSPLTISASGGTINVQSDMIMVGSTLTAGAITGNSQLTLSAGGGDSIIVQSNLNMSGGATLTAATLIYGTLTTEAGQISNISSYDMTVSNLINTSNLIATDTIEGLSVRAGQFSQASDYRIKENIIPLKNALQTILKIEPKLYDLKTTKRREAGLIVQDIYYNVPELKYLLDLPPENEIGTNIDSEYTNWHGLKIAGIDYSKFVPYLIKSIQELETRLNILENSNS